MESEEAARAVDVQADYADGPPGLDPSQAAHAVHEEAAHGAGPPGLDAAHAMSSPSLSTDQAAPLLNCTGPLDLEAEPWAQATK